MPSRRPRIALFAASMAVIAALVPNPVRAESCRDQPVVMISTSWCGYCRKARQFFADNNIDFEEIDAERTTSPGIRETYRRTGVPLIIVGAQEIRGFNEPRLRRALCLPS